VSYWTDRIAQDSDRGLEARREELLMQDLERFMENCLGHAPRNKSWVSYKGQGLLRGLEYGIGVCLRGNQLVLPIEAHSGLPLIEYTPVTRPGL
jgi:hypothetical protein